MGGFQAGPGKLRHIGPKPRGALRVGGIAIKRALLHALQDRRHPKEAEGELDIDIRDPFNAASCAIGLY